MDKPSITLLKEHGLRVTIVRERVLELFLAARKTALANADIERHFDRLDRTTLYRTLRTLEEKGIIHQVFDNSGTPKYAIGSEESTKHKHQEEHVHFHCVICEKTVCLENTKLPNVETPSGFKVEEKHLVLSGTCDNCSEEL